MRDANRIPKVLAELHKIWAQFPDLRLGQLIDNATAIAADSGVNLDLFYVEDEKLLDLLREFEKRFKGK